MTICLTSNVCARLSCDALATPSSIVQIAAILAHADPGLNGIRKRNAGCQADTNC